MYNKFINRLYISHYNTNKYIISIVSVVVITLFLQACSNQAKRVYEESSFGLPLEVPPDLTKPSNEDDLSFLGDIDKPVTIANNQSVCACDEGAGTNLVVLPAQEYIGVGRDGAQRWLMLKGEPRNIWPWIRDFWLKNNFKLSIEDPVIGLIETDWQQQRNNLPIEEHAGNKKVAEEDIVDSKIYAVPTREKYRVRLESGEQPGTTNIFLTHRGVELLADGKMIVWKLRPTDVELEAEMLTRLMVFLGEERKKVGGPLASTNQHLNIASLIKDESGHLMIKIDMEFSRIWRRIGIVLDRMNFLIEGRDRSVGTYRLVFKDPLKDDDVKEEKGWFSSWFSSEMKEPPKFQIVLRDEGTATHITVRNVDGTFSSEEKTKKLLEEIINHLQ